MSFTYAIEPPSPLAPMSTWRRFLAVVMALPQDDEGVRLARRVAERRIAEFERPRPPRQEC